MTTPTIEEIAGDVNAEPELEARVEIVTAGERDDEDPDPSPGKTEKDLDDQVALIRRLQVQTFDAYYALAIAIAEIRRKGLWKLRRTEGEGTEHGRYKSFKVFAKRELRGMSEKHALALVEIAKRYSAEEFRELGSVSKVTLILEAPHVDRARLESMVKDGASYREVRREVTESRKKHGSPKTSQQAKAGTHSAEKRAEAKAAPPKEQISIAMFPPETVVLFRGLWGETLPTAFSPNATVVHASGLTQHFTLQRGKGGLVLRITTSIGTPRKGRR